MNRKLSGALAALALSLLVVGGIAACFKQKQGDRCQVQSDCEDGLVCNKGKNPPVCDDNETGTALDALLPIDAAPDAPPDAP